GRAHWREHQGDSAPARTHHVCRCHDLPAHQRRTRPRPRRPSRRARARRAGRERVTVARPSGGGSMTATVCQPGPDAEAWRRAVADFAGHLSRLGHTSADTAATYCRRVLAVAGDLSADPWTLTSADLSAVVDARNWSASTRQAARVARRRSDAWAVQAGRVQRSPLAGIGDGTPKRPGPLTRDPSRLWHDPVAEYLTTLRAAGRSPGTVRLYRHHLRLLGDTFADPWQVTGADLASFLSQPDWSPEYRRSITGTIRRFYRWATVAGHAAFDPSAELLPVSVPRGLPRPAPDDVILTALERADDRCRLAVELAMYAGLRIGEAAGLAVADVLADRLRVRGKGGHERLVPLHPSLALTLRAEHERRRRTGETSPWLFPSQAGGHLQAGTLSRLVSAVMPPG